MGELKAELEAERQQTRDLQEQLELLYNERAESEEGVDASSDLQACQLQLQHLEERLMQVEEPAYEWSGEVEFIQEDDEADESPSMACPEGFCQQRGMVLAYAEGEPQRYREREGPSARTCCSWL